MRLAIPKRDGEFYTFTNEDLKTGDKVFPLVNGWSHNGEWYLTDLAIRPDRCTFSILACTGWHGVESKREPHTIVSFFQEEGMACIRTDKGYSPAEVYFKFLGVESMGFTRAGPCSECSTEDICNIKQNRKGGCSFYSKRRTAPPPQYVLCTHPDHDSEEDCQDRAVGCSKHCQCCMGADAVPIKPALDVFVEAAMNRRTTV